MAEEIEDKKIRDRNVITLPKKLMNLLNLSKGDIVGFDIVDDRVCIHKVVPHRMRNVNCQLMEEEE